MRQIKFRTYVKFLREMHEVREMIFDKGTVMIDAYQYGLDKDDAPIMQYTGLNDKNGVEIYEGDILNFNVRKDTNIPNSKAFYGERGVVKISPRGNSFGQWDSVYCTNLQVIGNIHQNPELLERNQ